jgi:site-specific DNA-methyltransferase (adenine-specific)/modification methylase
MVAENQIYCESNTETMSRLPDGSVDLIITSPPYNMRTRVRNGGYMEREKTKHFSNKYKHFHDAYPLDEFYSFHSSCIKEMLRVSKIVCYNIQIVTGSKEAFFKIIGEFSEYIKDIIIWDKGSGQPAMHEKILNSSYELIIIMESDRQKGRVINNAYFNRGEMSNIIRCGRDQKANADHGAVFPERLVRMLIMAFSDVNALVYDPFGGTGTVAVSAHNMKRRWILSEISEEYCAMAQSRINQLSYQSKLF